MLESKRQNILTIAGGNSSAFPVIYGIDKGFKHSTHIFDYCVSRNIVGDSFLRLCQDYKFLPIRIGNYLLKKMDHDQFRPLTWKDLA